MAKIKTEKKTVALSSLIENPKNPNIHPKEQIQDIAKSIKEYGQYYPIIIDEGNMILAGHGKKKALELLESETADVIQMFGLTAKQKNKILLSDNKIQTMSFLDHRIEESLIREIGDVDIIGYNADYVADLIHPVSVDTIGVETMKPTAQYAAEAQQMNTPTPPPMPAATTPPPAQSGEYQPQSEQAYQPTPQPPVDDADPMASFTSKHYITCPHCGQQIEI